MSLPNIDQLIALGLIKPRDDLTADMSLGEARHYVEANKDNGVECPCCGLYARRYVRKLNSGMARVLIYLVKNCSPPQPEEWVHVKRFVRISREGCQLVWWGLVEQRENTDPSKRASGLWRPTQKGVQFAYGHFSLPERAVVFNRQLEGYDGENITIRDALGSEFNYAELMGQTVGVP